LVTDYSLVQFVLRDARFSRAAATAKSMYLFDDAPEVVRQMWSAKMVNSDDPDHKRLRQIINRSLTPAAVARWRPRITEVVEELLDGVSARGKMDLVREFAYPLPERMICAMLGVPFSDHAKFEDWSVKILNRVIAGAGDEGVLRASTEAMLEFAAYLRDLVGTRKDDLRDDLLSQLITAEEQGDRLNDIELIAVLIELIAGGHDTTANLITQGVLLLMECREEWEELKADVSLVPRCVEEIFRLRSPIQLGLARVATEDVELGGVTIAAGESVLTSLAAGNRDPAVFADPDRFDIRREGNQHLSLGYGTHYCIGANLARAEAQEAFRGLAERLPGLRLAVGREELVWRETSLVVAPAALPVEW
jgi:cytochrome P450 PksS